MVNLKIILTYKNYYISKKFMFTGVYLLFYKI